MSIYRKKPVEIEARPFTGKSLIEDASVAKWCSGQLFVDDHLAAEIVIHTLEGDMRADPGDFIIKGVQGEFYPCKPDIFAQTYELVASDD